MDKRQGQSSWMGWWGRVGVMALSLTILTLSCGCTRVSPGYVGVKSTYVGTGRGMEGVATGPAWVGYNLITENVFEYPTFIKTVIWQEGEALTFAIKGNNRVSANASISIAIRPDGAGKFYLQFRNDDVETFMHTFLRSVTSEILNETSGQYDVDAVMGNGGPFLEVVKGKVQGKLDPYGVDLKQFGFVGAVQLPKVLQDAIDAKSRAIQSAIQAENELRQATAEAAKVVAEAEGDAKAVVVRAEGQAKANTLLANSLSSNLIQQRTIDKWDGVLPQVASGATPLFNLGALGGR
jgi:regulator of protease activity HflC (stomatin/prohibitin superfamily)